MSENTQTTADADVVTIADASGRRLSLREPDFMKKARITRLCGDDSSNIGYMYGFVWPTCWVVAIDDVSVPFPATFLQLEGLMTRVGEDGVAAVITHRMKASEEKAASVEASAKN